MAPPGGLLIDPESDLVVVDGRTVSSVRPTLRHLAVNKPLGVVSTVRDPLGRPTVVDLVPVPERLYPVGRLDVDSHGLLLLTNDGDLALRLSHPRFGVPKTYRLTVAGELSRQQLDQLRAGPDLDDGPTHPLGVRLVRRRADATLLSLEIAEGRNRQVRRMAEAIGARVLELQRVEFAGIRLGTLPLGAFRELGAAEVARLRSAGARS